MSGSSPEANRACPTPGYVFIGEPREGTPEPYLAKWHDELGFFARITPHHLSGAFPVPLVDYLRASAAYEVFVAQANELGDLSEQVQAIQREFIKQLGVDPNRPSIRAIADAAARTTKRKMLVHARYEATKNAWEDASRDVETTAELTAREQAFADALEISAYRRHAAQCEETTMVVH